MTEITNSDVKVLGTKIDGLTTQVGKLETKQDAYHEDSQKRLVVAEKHLALMQQSHDAVCKDIDQTIKPGMEKLSKRQDKNDLWTKIIGSFEGFLTMALAYLGITK